ncbi:MAG: aminoacyl--tRNA ligase-related protein [Patescibacteria group bacterium]
MRQSQLFTKTRREAPADEVSKNAILLTRAGFIHKEMAGVYSYLPLGLKVLKKIESVIREEMDKLGAQEIELATFQNKELWEKTNRWDDKIIDVWYKLRDEDIGLGFTHEEPLTAIAKEYVQSYRDLPFSAYQFQTKFRRELRTKSGIMRGREFLMKDLYSFCENYDQHRDFYKKAQDSYKRIFDRVGIGHLTYLTYASGGSFSDVSHEFQTITASGEDIIFIREENDYAVNKEIFNDEWKAKLNMNKFREEKSIEVGNIFNLGTKFSEALGLKYKEIDGSERPVWMGSYGIGLGRLMGTVVEVLSDEKGIVWPKEVAPFQVHLISLNQNELSDEVYKTLRANKIDVLYDDRDVRAGEKFADADLIGIPLRVVIGEKSLESKMLEVKNRNADEVRQVTLEYLLEELKS